MTAPVTPEYAGAAYAHAAPLVDQEYLREDDQAEHGEEHDDQHERHVGTFLEDTGVRPAPAGAGSSAAHALAGSASDKLEKEKEAKEEEKANPEVALSK